jgi:hypothetical protein
MATGVLSSDVNLGLPHVTPVDSGNIALNNHLQDVLNAFRIVQQELTAAKARIAALEAYNIAHP